MKERDESNPQQLRVGEEHHFMRASHWVEDAPMDPVTVIFDRSPPRYIGGGDFERDYRVLYDNEARRFADLMRHTMPQGLRDRVAAHLMADVLSSFVISEDGLAERDHREQYTLDFVRRSKKGCKGECKGECAAGSGVVSVEHSKPWVHFITPDGVTVRAGEKIEVVLDKDGNPVLRKADLDDIGLDLEDGEDRPA